MVDIVIPFFNKSELTIQCLSSVISTMTLDCVLIIVDDGSDRDHSEKVLSYLHERKAVFKFLKKDFNEGFKKAVRAGIRRCESKYVILLNNDTITTPGFDYKLTRLLESFPDIKAVGPVSNHPTDLFQFRPILKDVKFETVSAIDDQDLLWNDPDHLPGKQQFTYTPYLTGMCLAIDRFFFESIGIFDDIYEHGYFEDLDLCCQIREKGYRLAIAEDCFVFHHGHATYRQKAVEEKHRIIWNNFDRFTDRWSHISEHNELLQKMEFAGKHDPI
jgi:GT2 family glycosyltransferase